MLDTLLLAKARVITGFASLVRGSAPDEDRQALYVYPGSFHGDTLGTYLVSFETDERREVPRRLHELTMAAQEPGFDMETAMVQDHRPEGEWEDQPDGSRAYGPPLGEHDS